jgi:adenylyl-sulfate kinase
LGKSTIANVLRIRFLELGGRPVTLLDRDIARKHLSSEIGFSREHRDINLRRIGFVASQIAKNGGIAICAPIAPYDEVRKEVETMIRPHGGFVLVSLSTPLAVCESRDREGLYAKARAGLVKQFTGNSDPYEAPAKADVVIDTTDTSPEESAQEVFLHLEWEGFVGVEDRDVGRLSPSDANQRATVGACDCETRFQNLAFSLPGRENAAWAKRGVNGTSCVVQKGRFRGQFAFQN